MKKELKHILFILVAFTTYFLLDEFYFYSIRDQIQIVLKDISISHMIAYIAVGLPIILATYVLNGWRSIPVELGLKGKILTATTAAIIFTLPMFIGYYWSMGIPQWPGFANIVGSVIAAGFFEELYFRGFLFGQLYRKSRLGFIPSVFLGALLFAFVHMGQSSDPLQILGILMTTFLGGLLFSWLFIEWNFNLWVPILLHMFMNLSWIVFSAGNNAMGTWEANSYRIATVALALGGTVWYKKRKNQSMTVRRQSVWVDNKIETTLYKKA